MQFHCFYDVINLKVRHDMQVYGFYGVINLKMRSKHTGSLFL